MEEEESETKNRSENSLSKEKAEPVMDVHWEGITKRRKLALERLSNEIKVIKQELVIFDDINATNLHVNDFEDRSIVFKKNLCFYDPVFVKRGHIVHNIDSGSDLKGLILQAYDYYRIGKHIPLLYVLKDSKKTIYTDEWIEAHEEQKRFRILGNIERLRLSNKINIDFCNEDIEEDIIENEVDEKEIKKLKLKSLAEDCKRFITHNKLIVSENNNLYNFKNVKYPKFIIESKVEEKKAASSKGYLNAFDYIRKTKSKNIFNFPAVKKSLTSLHSSHSSALSKVTPELSKIQDAVGIVDYKIRNRQKIINYGFPNNTARDFSRSYLTGNVSFNLKAEEKRQRR